VVNPFVVTEPMVGWKRAPVSAVTSDLVFLISILCLVFLKWYIMNTCSCLYADNDFCVE
jgi:hypothetical protein